MSIISTIIKNLAGVKQKPSFVTFFVTWRCNNKCVMCDVWKKEAQKELSAPEVEAIFKGLGKIDAIRISGGEPFLRSDLAEIINIIDKVSKPKVIHITTNGFLTKKITETVSKIKNPSKIHIKISIDGIGEKHDKIRGIPGAYDNAIATIKDLAELRKEKKFYLGVNQTIVGKESMGDYFKLTDILKDFGVKVHPVLAYKNATALYSAEKAVEKKPEFETYGLFDKNELGKFIKSLVKNAGRYGDFKETLVKKYYLKGLYNRVIKGKNKPKPPCLALKSHLRILPNGDVPVCLYNSLIVGNLKDNTVKEIWDGENINKHRKWVKNCRGCWAGCETIVSAIYSGDIAKGLL